MNKLGRLITLEGIECAGKSTQIEYLQTYFNEKKIDVTFTREPGGNIRAEKIRKVLLKGKNHNGIMEALLFSLARYSHVRDVINPSLQEGKWVICDRFIDSTRAYQGGGRRVPMWLIETLIRISCRKLIPDLTLILDIDPTIIKQRLLQRDKNNHFDNECLDFFMRARETYQKIAQKEPNRVYIIDAEQPKSQVSEILCQIIDTKIKLWSD